MGIIKRYANRKLYDTDAKRYVTLEDVAEAIRRGDDVRIVDHVSGEDLTSVTMLQIIFEEQKRIGGLLPGVFLARLIQAGGETVSAVRSRLAGFDPFQAVDEEIRRRVLALVEQGQLSAEEGLRISDLLVRKPDQADVIHIPVKGEDEPLSAAEAPVAGMDTPDPAAVNALLRQVDDLERELERLKQARAAANG
jgi:polyhydroxyalkanoate synthesis repressor PhaR